jgi:O-antigen ligase
MSHALPRKDQILVALLGTELCLLPWALGGDLFWCRLFCFLLSFAALLLALRPSEDGRHPFHRLGKSPGAWCCAGLLLYLLLQTVNPSHVLHGTPGAQPTLSTLSHWELLPSGILSTVTEHEGPWKQLLFPMAVICSGLAVSLGLKRRGAIELLMTIAVINATGVAIHGLLTRGLQATQLYWCLPCDTDFVASFPYRNHAAAYFYLHCGLAIAMASGCYQHYRREGLGLRRCLLFCSLSLLLALAAIFTKSRTAVVMIGLLYCGTPLLIALYSWSRTRWLSRRRLTLLAGAWLFGILATLTAAHFTTVSERFAELLGGRSYSIAAREAGAAATLELAGEAPVFGHGLGSFPLFFEPFQKRHPAMELGGPFTKVWPHAHNDYIEALIELGMLGCLPLAVLLVIWFLQLLRNEVWKLLPASILLFSCCLLLLHAAFEYLFSNPSLLLSFVILAACLLRYCHISIERDKERLLSRTLR